MLNWELIHPRATMYHLGYIGAGLSEKNPLSTAKQIDILYPFGGWSKFDDGKMRHMGGHVMQYPGDPPLYPIARAKLRDETVCVYQSDWWAIFQPDGSFEMARLD